MTILLHRFRSIGIALAVLAISATVAFAAAPVRNVSPLSVDPSPSVEPSVSPDPSVDPSPSAEPSVSPDPSVDPSPSVEPSVSPDPSVEPTDSAEPSESAPADDTHGALVSAAAQMETPEGFANHGAFVSCVAHMHVTLAEIDWTTVTPDTCAAAKGKSLDAAATGKTKGQSGKGHGSSAHGAPTRTH